MRTWILTVLLCSTMMMTILARPACSQGKVFGVAYANSEVAGKSYAAVSEVLEVAVTHSNADIVADFKDLLECQFPGGSSQYTKYKCRVFKSIEEADSFRADLKSVCDLGGIEVVTIPGDCDESGDGTGEEMPAAHQPRSFPPPHYTDWPFTRAEAKRRQAETAQALDLPVEMEIQLREGLKIVFMLIPAGEYDMGSPEDERGRFVDEGPVHRVRISKPFYLGKYEVSQAEFEVVMEYYNPSEEKDPASETFRDWRYRFVPKMQNYAPEGWRFRIPTEAEWEYACRAGSNTPFSEGSQLFSAQFNSSVITSVGNYPPNSWGLHDMNGNALEYCDDWYSKSAYSESTESDPVQVVETGMRVVRGGSYKSGGNACRSAARGVLCEGANPKEEDYDQFIARLERAIGGKSCALVGKSEALTEIGKHFDIILKDKYLFPSGCRLVLFQLTD